MTPALHWTCSCEWHHHPHLPSQIPFDWHNLHNMMTCCCNTWIMKYINSLPYLKWQKDSVVLLGKTPAQLVDGFVSMLMSDRAGHWEVGRVAFLHIKHKKGGCLMSEEAASEPKKCIFRSSWDNMQSPSPPIDKCQSVSSYCLPCICIRVVRWMIALTNKLPELGQSSVRPSLSVKCVRKVVPWPLPQQLSWNAETTHRTFKSWTPPNPHFTRKCYCVYH